MDKVLVINLTAVTQHVGVIHANGDKDDIQLMPRKRAELRMGMTVDPAWLGRNINCVRVVAPQPLVPTVVAARKDSAVSTPDLTVADLVGSDDPGPQVTVADLEAEADKEGDA